MELQQFDNYRFFLEEEIRGIDEMEARGEDLDEKPFYSRDLVLYDRTGKYSYRDRRSIIKHKLKRHLQKKEKLDRENRQYQ